MIRSYRSTDLDCLSSVDAVRILIAQSGTLDSWDIYGYRILKNKKQKTDKALINWTEIKVLKG